MQGKNCKTVDLRFQYAMEGYSKSQLIDILVQAARREVKDNGECGVIDWIHNRARHVLAPSKKLPNLYNRLDDYDKAQAENSRYATESKIEERVLPDPD